MFPNYQSILLVYHTMQQFFLLYSDLEYVISKFEDGICSTLSITSDTFISLDLLISNILLDSISYWKTLWPVFRILDSEPCRCSAISLTFSRNLLIRGCKDICRKKSLFYCDLYHLIILLEILDKVWACCESKNSKLELFVNGCNLEAPS